MDSKMFLWTTEKSSALIESYRLYPCLYNTKIQDYKDRVMRQDAWELIANELGTAVSEITKKVRGLRTQYAREKVKIIKRENELGSTGLPYHSSWVHYNALSFLDEFTTTKLARLSNDGWAIDYNQDMIMQDTEEQDSLNPTAYVISEDVKSEYDDSRESPIVINGIHSPPSLNHIVSMYSPQAQPDSTKSTKRQRMDNHTTTVLATRQVVAQQQQKPSSSSLVDHNMPDADTTKSTATEDENDELFVKYIASELKQIKNNHLKRIVKHNIQNLIFEAHCSLQDKT